MYIVGLSISTILFWGQTKIETTR